MNAEVKKARVLMKKEVEEKKNKFLVFNEMLDQLEECNLSYLEDGDCTAVSAMNSAHTKVKKLFGDKKYKELCDWLDENNPGPHG